MVVINSKHFSDFSIDGHCEIVILAVQKFNGS